MPVAGQVIGAVGSIGGSAMGARGAANAAEAEQQGQREAIQAQLAMFNQARADQMPMIQARNAALPLFMQLLGLPAMSFGAPSDGGVQMNIEGAKKNDRSWRTHFEDQLGIPGVGSISSNPIKGFQDTLRTPFRNFGDWDGSRMADDPGRATFTFDEQGNVVSSPTGSVGGTQPTSQPPLDLNALIAATPGYQFRLNQGLQGIDRSAAARGGLNSGAALKALQRYGEGLASEEYGNFANRLASLIGLGQTAATTTGGWGINTGQNLAQNLANIGASRGSSYANQANMWGQGIGGAANAFSNYWAGRPQSAPSTYNGPYT